MGRPPSRTPPRRVTFWFIAALWILFVGFAAWMFSTRAPWLAFVAVILGLVLLVEATASSLRMLRSTTQTESEQNDPTDGS